MVPSGDGDQEGGGSRDTGSNGGGGDRWMLKDGVQGVGVGAAEGKATEPGLPGGDARPRAL